MHTIPTRSFNIPNVPKQPTQHKHTAARQDMDVVSEW